MAYPLKSFLARVPAVTSLYDSLRPERPRTRYNLEQLRAHLPKAIEQIRPWTERANPGKNLVLFATLHYWIEQVVMLGLALRGLGHNVTIAYLPYSSWDKQINAFDLRRQDLYTRRVLSPLKGLVAYQSLLDAHSNATLPGSLEYAIESASAFDTMYSLQVEEIERDSDLYRLRVERNRLACLAALSFLENRRTHTILLPNGLVTELGIFYQTARHLDLPTVTYEFNDQREQIWIAQNEIVMHQNTDELWRSRSNWDLSESEREKLAAFEDARSSARVYAKGTRFWQDAPAEGSEHLRKRLGLDERPVILLATNVLGDSLTLGRHIFSTSMAEWIERTVRYFVDRPDIQLVVRVHPGERLTKGPSMSKVIEHAAPQQPEHIHTIGPTEKINTYDVMEITNLGLVYTTTVGLEMALRGIPVIVAGETHYRRRGFTLDPSTWDEYFAMLGDVLDHVSDRRLVPAQVQTAWNYAYRFFFEYAHDFPWRLMHLWQDVEIWPLQRVLSAEGQAMFGRTFGSLTGERISW